MITPMISVVPHTNATIVNKKIVYSDTLLKGQGIGETLHITSISAGKFSFESCLKTILDSNPSVTFHTIQYSETENKVYFYTNDFISTKLWEDQNKEPELYSSITTEVLSDLKSLLVNPIQGSSDTISIYDVMTCSTNMKTRYSNAKEYHQRMINSKLRNIFSFSCRCLLPEFNYEEDELTIKISMLADIKEYQFKKENISKTPFLLMEDEIIACIDDLSSFRKFRMQNSKVKTVNSGFVIEINEGKVKLTIPGHFFITRGLQHGMYECNSDAIATLLNGSETELFQRIFVKIDDCPEWMQPILYYQRQVQLEDEQELQQEGNRMSFIRNNLPFIS